MKPQWVTTAKFCAVLGSIVGSATVDPSPYSWHSVLLLVSMFLPTLAFLTGNYRVYVTSAVACSASTLLEACRVMSCPIDYRLVSASLLLLTAILSLVLAVEDVAVRVAGDVLSEKWSQSQTMTVYTIEYRIVCYGYALLSVS